MSASTEQERSIVLQRREEGGYSFVEISNPTPEILDALKGVGEDDPAICLDWNLDNLEAAAAWANQQKDPPVALPPWYTSTAAGQEYPVTAAGIRAGLAALLAQSGSGHQLGAALLAPIDMAQFLRIQQKIQQLNMGGDPFLGAICANHNHCPLARVYVLADAQRHLTGVHMPMAPRLHGMGVDVFE